MFRYQQYLLTKLSYPYLNLLTPKLSKMTASSSTMSNNTQIDTDNGIYFWKPDQRFGFLGQWYKSPFTVDSEDGTRIQYQNCEQYMMHQKGNNFLIAIAVHGEPLELPMNSQDWQATGFSACLPTCLRLASVKLQGALGVLFAPDSEVTAEILAKGLHPAQIKALGRAVPDFDEATWKKHRYEIVVRGNLYKFRQDEKLKKQLLETGNKELVEASPRDRIWGVGYGAVNAPKNRKKWGLNLLGKALMEVRETIRKEEGEEGKEETTTEEVQ